LSFSAISAVHVVQPRWIASAAALASLECLTGRSSLARQATAAPTRHRRCRPPAIGRAAVRSVCPSNWASLHRWIYDGCVNQASLLISRTPTFACWPWLAVFDDSDFQTSAGCVADFNECLRFPLAPRRRSSLARRDWRSPQSDC
jgi:hypothetical protein